MRPRWDLYPVERALMGIVQTSRGCPFECEFCDVIQYLGRKQRHKKDADVLAELDVLYGTGFRSIFLADDNFTASRRRVKELLRTLATWNDHRTGGLVSFATQVSVDAAKDYELLSLCARAGIDRVFIGLETPSQASLLETRKRQNIGVDLVEATNQFLAAGILVTAGLIVGFDADTLETFDMVSAMANASSIPIFSIGPLTAPAATPLYARLSREGRIKDQLGADAAATPWQTNIIPKQMTQEQLLAGIGRLCRTLYAPGNFGARVLRMIERLPPRKPAAARTYRAVELETLQMASLFPRLGSEERSVFREVASRSRTRPELSTVLSATFAHYMQVRMMFEMGGVW